METQAHSRFHVTSISFPGLKTTNIVPSPALFQTAIANLFDTSPGLQGKAPVDATLIHETWYHAHKVYICIPETAHHSKFSHMPTPARYTGGYYILNIYINKGRIGYSECRGNSGGAGSYKHM